MAMATTYYDNNAGGAAGGGIVTGGGGGVDTDRGFTPFAAAARSFDVTAAVGEARGQFLVLGYSDRMDELMRMSDLFIGKPGGLTSSEAMACGLPMMIFSPIPGQEERNADHLLEEGAGLRCNELTTMPFKIDRLLANPRRLVAMSEAARALGKPGASRAIVNCLLDEVAG